MWAETLLQQFYHQTVTAKMASQTELNPVVLYEPLYVLQAKDGTWMVVFDEETKFFDDYEEALATFKLWAASQDFQTYKFTSPTPRSR